MTKHALLEALKEAEGPSRELDARIHHALNPNQIVMFSAGCVRTKEPASYGDMKDFPIDGWDDYRAVADTFGAKHYTSSLDACLALQERVLPGALVGLENDHEEWAAWCYGESGVHKTAPAIALLIALFEALIAQEQETE